MFLNELRGGLDCQMFIAVVSGGVTELPAPCLLSDQSLAVLPFPLRLIKRSEFGEARTRNRLPPSQSGSALTKPSVEPHFGHSDIAVMAPLP
ncbi:MAG: hypothetical protein ACYC6O_07045 [Thermoleophilia bacterium]